MPRKPLFAGVVLCLLFPIFGVAHADNAATHEQGTYTGPPYGPGTAIPNKPDFGSTSPTGPIVGPQGTGLPAFRFTTNSRNTISNFFMTYWLCPACGYMGGSYAIYQPGEILPNDTFQPFPQQLIGQLPAPPPGTQYVFANRNALLISQSTGQILDVIPLVNQ